MANTTIPEEFDLKTSRRYKRQNMAKAMRGKIERGLVELITNSDDSYRDLEEDGVPITGKIRIEVERKRGLCRSRFCDRIFALTDNRVFQIETGAMPTFAWAC